MSTAQVKFEHSPVESLCDSFVSTPGTQYPSLFSNDDTSSQDAMTPRSLVDADESMFGESVAGTPAPDKKSVKKRKSWGQQLPEPKTNLPPRKRAKTEDEKEQRRVERVLRNRRAAQSSRERKRQEVEALENEKRAIERRNQDLEMRLADMENKNRLLQQQLEQATGGKMTVFRAGSVSASSPARSQAPVTFSQDLFASQKEEPSSANLQPILDAHANMQSAIRTVNPASLSPEIRPVAETSNASSTDMTQHPAAMLCDLQCQSGKQRPWTVSTTASSLAFNQILAMTSMISVASSLILSPLSQIYNSLTIKSTLSPTPSILTMIIWLVTTATTLTTSTLTTSSTTTTSRSLRPKPALRIRLLRRLLACSPHLARPLMDATLVALRSASEQQLARDCLSGVDAAESREVCKSPSVETLMTLLWATKVIEKELSQRPPKLDAAAEVRQACSELDYLFRSRDMKRHDDRTVSLVGGKGGILGQKSTVRMDGEWR